MDDAAAELPNDPNHQTDTVDRLVAWSRRQWEINKPAFIIVLLVNILALAYALSRDIYTNHTFPNALLLPRPSFRTSEGRWGTDFVYYLLGGSGVPLLSLLLAIVAQVVNGLIFSRLLGLTGIARTAICAALVSIHPFMLDYYAYSGDDLSFAVGDTLILSSVGIVGISPASWALSTVLFSVALSVYQPKLSLMLTAIMLTFVAGLLRRGSTAASLRELCRLGSLRAACAAAGAALYLGELRAEEWLAPAAGHYFRERTHAADLPAMLALVGPLLSNLRDRLLFDTTAFPRPVQWLLAAQVMCFAVLGMRRIRSVKDRRIGAASGALLLAAALVLPFCMYAALIASASDMDASRFYVPIAYLLGFLVAINGSLLHGRWTGRAWSVMSGLLITMFMVRDTQILHRASLSRTQEMSIVARVTDRLQLDPRYASARPHPLVVFGLPPHRWPPLDLGNGSIMSNFERPGFIEFRQVEALNFYAGMQGFQYPTRQDIDAGAGYAAAHATWPASDSVAILDSGIAVVVFERPGPGVSQTAAFGETAAAPR
jgi:hypothetical protein